MTRRVLRGAATGALALTSACCAGACSYPTFGFGPPGTGGAGPAASSAHVASSASSASSASAASSSSAATGSSSGVAASATSSSSSSGTGGSGGMPSSCPPHVVVTEIQTRGDLGGGDEFVALYNPTSQAVVLGPDWQIMGRSASAASDSLRWQGTGGVLPANGFFLIAGSDYSGAPFPDDSLAYGFSDAGRLTLLDGSTTVDAVCYAYDAMSLTTVEAFGCPGTPATNPHDDMSDSDDSRSIARAPLDCTDSGDNAKDFVPRDPSTPKNSETPPVVYP